MADTDERIFEEVADGSIKATNALNSLEKAVKSLDNISNRAKGIEALGRSFEALGTTIGSLKELPGTSKLLEKIDFTIFSDNMKRLSTSLEPLRGFRSSAGAILSGLTRLNVAVTNVNDTDYDEFGSNIELLASSLFSLKDVQSTIGTTLSSLAKLDEVLDQVSMLGERADNSSTNASKFKSNIIELSDALVPLNKIKISAGSTIVQLSKLVDTVKIINEQFTSEMASEFATSLRLLATSLSFITDDKIGKISLGRTVNAINKLIDVINKLDTVKSSYKTNFFDLLKRLSISLRDLSEIGKVNIGGFANSIKKIVGVVIELNSVPDGALDGVTTIDNILQMISGRMISLASIGKVNIGAFVNSLIRLVPALQQLNTVDSTSAQKLGAILETIVVSMSRVSGLKLGGLSSSINAISKLPKALSEASSISSEQIDKFVSRITELTNKLGPLATALAPVATILNNISVSARKSSTSMGDVGRASSGLLPKFGNLRRALGGFGLIYSFRMLYTSLSKCFDKSNDYIENLNVVAVSLGEASTEAVKYADSLNKTLGIDPSEFLRQWSEFNLQLKGFGNGTEAWNDKAYDMSRNLTQLGYDLASLYNVDIEVAMTKLASGMSGMSKPLRNWGFDISQAALQEYALSVGIEKNVQTMNQAEKAQLRYALIMSKTTDIQGDFAKTLETPANQLRVLKAQLTQLGRAVGEFITPIVAYAIPYVRAFISALTDMFNALAIGMRSLTGYKKAEVNDFLNDVSKDASDAEEEVESLDSAIGNLVSGIDKFNVLSQNNNKSVGGFFEGLETYDYTSAFEEAAKTADDTMKNIKESMQPFFNSIKEALSEVGLIIRAIGGPLNVLKIIIFAIIGSKLTSFIFSVVTALTTLNGVQKITLSLSKMISSLALTTLLFTITELLTKSYEELGPVKTILYSILAVVSALILASQLLRVEAVAKLIPSVIAGIQKLIPLLTSTKAIVMSLEVGAAAGFAAFILLFNQLSGKEKVIIPIIAAVVGLTAAIIAFKVASAGWLAAVQAGVIASGIALGVGALYSTIEFAKGGFASPGTQFVAGEKGPEWVGRQGSSSVILNDSQMSDIMYDAVRDGVFDAMARANSEDNKPNVYVNFDSKEFIRAHTGDIITEAQRQRYKIARG